MSYRIESFGAVVLPRYNRDQELTGGMVESRLVRTINGQYDVAGSRRAWPVATTYTVSGVLMSSDVAETLGYLSVNGVDRIVVAAGEPLLVSLRGPGEVRAQLDALRALIGVRDTLRRLPMAGGPLAAQTTLARLLSVRYRQDRRLGPDALEVETHFEALDPYWRGEARSTSGLVLEFVVNGNVPVRDAVLTITGTTASTRVTGAGIDWSYVGSDATLVVTGLGALANGIATAVTLAAGHSIDTLIELAPGDNHIQVVGASGASLGWYDKWA